MLLKLVSADKCLADDIGMIQYNAATTLCRPFFKFIIRNATDAINLITYGRCDDAVP